MNITEHKKDFNHHIPINLTKNDRTVQVYKIIVSIFTEKDGSLTSVNNHFVGFLSVFGDNTVAEDYWENNIIEPGIKESELKCHIISLIEDITKTSIKDLDITFSEWGMQPDDGWHFDISWKNMEN